MLSTLERGLASPTATGPENRAEGFGISCSQLFGGPARGAKRRAVVLNESEQAIFRDPDAGFAGRSLSPVGWGMGRRSGGQYSSPGPGGYTVK